MRRATFCVKKVLEITGVERGSVGEELGFEAGDKLVSFNCEIFEDILDYYFADGEEKLSLTIKTKQGKKMTCKLEKTADESLGFVFDGAELTPRRCGNKCVFCFIDQLPKGMRETLYVKDDDWKLSFISGNYVTFTNVKEAEIERIIKRKFSPLYVSVHATDEAVRAKLLGRKSGAEIMPLLQRFKKSGIAVHAQIVLVKGINDGDVLKRTLEDLDSLYPTVKSVSVVPVGLTAHREGLYPLEPVDRVTARAAIDITESINGCRDWCFCSDEMYLIAGKETKDMSYYGSNPQYENGVGMLSRFIAETKQAAVGRVLAGNYGIVTGVAAERMFRNIADGLIERNSGLRIEVFAIKNECFGETVTVSGLVTGKDIISQLKGRQLPPKLLLPRVMFREFETVMLDGTTLDKLCGSLGVKIEIVDVNGEKFIEAVSEK